MAFGVKYFMNFFDASNRTCTLEILQDGYTSTPSEMVAGVNPVVLRIDEQNKNIFDHIKKTSLDINIVKTYASQYDDLSTADNRDYSVRLKIDGSVEFLGWLITDGIVEKLRQTPYEIELQAIDGINRLKDFKLEKPAGYLTAPLTGDYYYRAFRISLAEIMKQVASKMPEGYTFRVVSRLVAAIGNRKIVAPSTLFDYSLFSGKTIYEALEMVLQSTAHKLIISRGIVNIYSIKEFEAWAYGESVPYEDYDANFVKIGEGSVAHPANIVGVNSTLLTGGTITRNAAWRDVSVNVDYGLKDNICPALNLDESVEKGENNTATIYFWERYGVITKLGAKAFYTDDDKPALLFDYEGGDVIESQALLLKFRVTDYLISGQNGRFHLSFEHRLYNNDENDEVNGNNLLTIMNGIYAGTLANHTYLKRFGKKYQLTNVAGVPPIHPPLYTCVYNKLNSTEDWQTFECDFDGGDINLSSPDISILLFPGLHVSDEKVVGMLYRNFKLYCTNVDDEGQRVRYKNGETIRIVNNDKGLVSGDALDVKIASIPLMMNGTVVYNAIENYRCCLLIDNNGSFQVLGNVKHPDFVDMEMPLQDFVGRVMASSRMVSQRVIKCDLKINLNDFIQPFKFQSMPEFIFMLCSGDYNYQKLTGNFEMQQYVPFVGIGWSRIIAENGDFIMTEDGLNGMLTEVNYSTLN